MKKCAKRHVFKNCANTSIQKQILQKYANTGNTINTRNKLRCIQFQKYNSKDVQKLTRINHN
jgi:hypothetical protein